MFKSLVEYRVQFETYANVYMKSWDSYIRFYIIL